ncbi:MAG: zinc-binding dehydrogenase [Gammaproteobacteria bacterium]|nr:zinc-binding dehydrogenase [Gammaproteobacteria bacterium]
MPERIVFPKKGQTRLESFELPDMGDNDVRVRTQYSVMSIGTETTILHQKYAPDTHFAKWFSFPQTKTGVQAIAVVEKVGRSVTEHSPGDTVFMRMAHGSHQVIATQNLTPVPAGIDLKNACWCGLAKTAFRAAWAADFRYGASVLVIGAGPVGQMVTRWAAAAGVSDLAVADISEARLRHAIDGGATITFAGNIADNSDSVGMLDGGRGPSTIIDTTGNPSALSYALSFAAKFGKIILLGDTGYPDRQQLTSDLMEKGLTIQATHDSHDRDGWTQRRVDKKFFELVAAGRFNLDGLITHEFAPEDNEEAYRLAEQQRNETLGILYDWTRQEY